MGINLEEILICIELYYAIFPSFLSQTKQGEEFFLKLFLDFIVRLTHTLPTYSTNQIAVEYADSSQLSIPNRLLSQFLILMAPFHFTCLSLVSCYWLCYLLLSLFSSVFWINKLWARYLTSRK